MPLAPKASSRGSLRRHTPRCGHVGSPLARKQSLSNRRPVVQWTLPQWPCHKAVNSKVSKVWKAAQRDVTSSSQMQGVGAQEAGDRLGEDKTPVHDPIQEAGPKEMLAFSSYGDYGSKVVQKSRAVYEVLRISPQGKVRTIYIKRRDLLRTYGLLPRDLRGVDLSWDSTQTSQTIIIKDKVILLDLGGVRLVVTSDKALLFEADKEPAKKFVEIVVPRLRSNTSNMLVKWPSNGNQTNSVPYPQQERPSPPFELEVLEGSLMIATGKLDGEFEAVMQRANRILKKLPQEINPVNLEELRRVKQACVELESRAEALRELLEELLDDEEEVASLNLSSRPQREARQRSRDRNRVRREQITSAGTSGDASYESAQDALEEMEDEEQEEREIEESEDMLEYYLQKASITQSEAKRVLEGARDLEESIGVSLSARRFEVNRLELMLSMGSFAAALGAMISGIFGMNLRNTLEMSVAGFYGITAAIVLGCLYVFFAIFVYTKKRRIV